jgi:DNA-binding response OmpR family regulator
VPRRLGRHGLCNPSRIGYLVRVHGTEEGRTEVDTRDKHRVLIVEDHEGMRHALCGLFRRVGWEVVGVGTVADGLAALEPPPECAVVDLHLPDGEGEAIVRRVKEGHLPTCVTVVCTGTDDQARLRAVAALGPDALLCKPVEFEEVLSACQASYCR